MALRLVPIHRALNRPSLFMGAEREPALMLLMFVSLLAVTLVVPALIMAAILFVVGFGVLRAVAKHDPFMMRVWLRHIRYQSFYPARSSVFALPAAHKGYHK